MKMWPRGGAASRTVNGAVMLTRINKMAGSVGLAVSRFIEAAYGSFIRRPGRLTFRIGTNRKVDPVLHGVIGSGFSMSYGISRVSPELDRGLGIRIATRLGECG